MTKPTGRPRGRPKTKEYVTLMARVPQELAERVQRYAGLHQQSISVVLRDALEVLLEEDRYHPFLSDRNTALALRSDTKAESADILSDTKEALASIMSDTNRETAKPRAVTAPQGRPVKVSDAKAARREILSDAKADVPDFPSDTKAEDCPPDMQAILPDMVSDRKAATTASTPVSAVLSDTNAPAFDTTKYVLGKLCPRGHDYHGTGRSLRRLPRAVCLQCDAEWARERRQTKRQATQR
jgi:hypothetical protein